MTKAKGVPTPARLLNLTGRKAYVQPLGLRLAAERAKDHPKPISLNSPVKYEYHGDDK